MKSVSHGTMALAAALAVAGAVWAAPPSFSPIERDMAGAFVMRVQDDCEDLRRACLDREAIGEQGQGNCRRYRGQCGVSPDYCARLLRDCMRKDASGPNAGRSCRHYRLECQARL